MPGAGVVAGKLRKQRAAAQALKDNKEGEGEAKRKEFEVCGYQLFHNFGGICSKRLVLCHKTSL